MYGGCLDPHACFLLNRGIQTLGLRMRKQCETALAVAQMLEKHPMVGTRLYRAACLMQAVDTRITSVGQAVTAWHHDAWHGISQATSVSSRTLETGLWVTHICKTMTA